MKNLVTEYPFLIPRHITGDHFGEIISPYNYDWCEISRLPWGWQITFIKDFLEELKDFLIRNNILDKYFVIVATELNNEFIWRGNLDYYYPQIHEIVKKYNLIIKDYCIYCGNKPDYKATWGYSICKDCLNRRYSEINKEEFNLEFLPINS